MVSKGKNGFAVVGVAIVAVLLLVGISYTFKNAGSNQDPVALVLKAVGVNTPPTAGSGGSGTTPCPEPDMTRLNQLQNALEDSLKKPWYGNSSTYPNMQRPEYEAKLLAEIKAEVDKQNKACPCKDNPFIQNKNNFNPVAPGDLLTKWPYNSYVKPGGTIGDIGMFPDADQYRRRQAGDAKKLIDGLKNCKNKAPATPAKSTAPTSGVTTFKKK